MIRAELFAQTAVGQIGTVEDPPGSNRNPYADEVGDPNGYAWCATFVHWCAQQVGLPFPHTAYVPTLEDWARVNGYTIPADRIRRGDIVCLDFTNPWADGSDHVEIALDTPERGWVRCVGGNTSDGSGSVDAGGGVYANTRPLSWVATAIRLPGSDDIIDNEEEQPMLTTWTIPDGTRYVADTRTGASRTAQDAFPAGLAGGEIEAAVAEMVRVGACKDLGPLGWNSNFVVRLSPTWPVQI